MIKKLTVKCLDLWADSNVIDAREREVYQYGMELLLSTLLNLGLMMVESVCVIQRPLAFIPYMIIYIPLRMTAGGYHAKSHWSCVLYTQGTFILSVLLMKFMGNYTVQFVLPVIALSIFIIWFLAPAETKNKPLSQSEWKKAKQHSRELELLFGLAAIVFTYMDKLHLGFVLAGIAANMSVAVSLITAKIDEIYE